MAAWSPSALVAWVAPWQALWWDSSAWVAAQASKQELFPLLSPTAQHTSALTPPSSSPDSESKGKERGLRKTREGFSTVTLGSPPAREIQALFFCHCPFKSFRGLCQLMGDTMSHSELMRPGECHLTKCKCSAQSRPRPLPQHQMNSSLSFGANSPGHDPVMVHTKSRP